jgi:chloramphenicol O-acetyltransferase type A
MKELDIETWERKEIFAHSSSLDIPFYSLTTPVDVTRIKEVSKNKKLSFYYLMIYCVTRALNKTDEFLLSIHQDKIFYLNERVPSFTTLKPGHEAFIIVDVPLRENYEDFCQDCQKAISNQESLFGGRDDTEDLLYISCTPWFDFSSLTNERNLDKDDSVPRISWGQYYKEKGKLMLHLSLEVNHRLIDGIHIAEFLDNLKKEIAALD